MKKMSSVKKFMFLTTCLILVFYVAHDSSAADFKNSLKGKVVVLETAHGAGGGFDTYCRLMAPIIRKHTGATVVIKNLPGAGGTVGRSKFFTQTKPDGMSISLVSVSSGILSQLAEAKGVKYQMEKFEYLGRVVNEARLLAVATKGPYKTWEDLKAEKGPVKFAWSGVGDDDFYLAGIMTQLHGINQVPVTGYEGSPEAMLAVAKGEAAAHESSYLTIMTMVRSGDLKPILIGALQRVPELSDVPTAMEVTTDPKAKRIVKAMLNMFEVDRAMALPPGTKPEVVKAWREIMSNVLNDKELIAVGAKIKRDFRFLDGESCSKLIKEAVAAGDEIKPMLKKAVAAAQ